MSKDIDVFISCGLDKEIFSDFSGTVYDMVGDADNILLYEPMICTIFGDIRYKNSIIELNSIGQRSQRGSRNLYLCSLCNWLKVGVFFNLNFFWAGRVADICLVVSSLSCLTIVICWWSHSPYIDNQDQHQNGKEGPHEYFEPRWYLFPSLIANSQLEIALYDLI